VALGLKQQLKLSQQLVMTPQLQQAIKLLQLNQIELEGLVQQELQENPVLEDVRETDDESVNGVDAQPSAENPPPGEAGETPAAETPAEAPGQGEGDPLSEAGWESYLEPYTGGGGMREVPGDDDRPSVETTLTRRATLTEHLEWQLQLSSLPIEEDVVARLIIGNLDDRGYLQASIEDLARQAGVRESVVEAALARVQELDPAGVAARDLRECLRIQARVLGIEDPIVLRILDEHLDRLIKPDFRGVAKAMGIAVEEVAAAARVIGKLEPRPGRAFGGEDPVYIVPDIYVTKVGDEFHIQLNDDGLPRLRISSLYREVLARGSSAPKDTRDYVNEKVRSAMWLIKSIHQRQRTIFKVMQSILKHQREFFERGINYLKPLNLRDVADDIEMHESTVSRVTTNKYAHTPQGIFELKYFFNSSINRVDGEAVASESVKERILRLIRNEDPARPLSDQRIAEMLRVANINIARRTVTKYRESMKILSSTKRRQVG
jgi:RNA polymerase sigma-54 factor